MFVSEKELRAVTSLPGEERYRYFIKRVVDAEKAWGLWSDGWALAATDDAQLVFPLWPAKRYAGECAIGDWSGYTPEEIALDGLIDELIPQLMASSTLVGVFPTPQEQSVMPAYERLLLDLAAEEQNY